MGGRQGVPGVGRAGAGLAAAVGGADRVEPAEDPAAGACPGPADDPAAPYARLAVVCLIRHPDDDRWLLVRPPRDREVWAPAGGRLERGETLEAAVHREMAEELDLPVQVAGPCYAYVTMHKGERMVGVTMACRADGDRPLRLDPAEAVDWRWVCRAEWLAMAAAGLTPWTPGDIVSATTLAATLLDLRAGPV